jgi:hypothetical protein
MKNLMKNLNFYKIKKVSYVYTTPNTRISDLNYKEEIFEYFAYNSEKLNESEIDQIFNKLFKFKILKNEIIDYKNFLRNFLSIDKDWITEDIVKNSLLLFLDKHKDVDEYLKDEYESPSNQFDANFIPINIAFYNFINKNYYKLKNENIILLFNFLQHFGTEDNKLFKNVLVIYNINNALNSYKSEHNAEVMISIIKMLRKKNIKLDDDVKDVIKKYTLNLELKSYKNNNNHKELYYSLSKYIMDIKDNQKPIELLELGKRLEKFFLVNKIVKDQVFREFENNLQYKLI